MKTFRSNGKLLLTGEYVVLDGALSLAIPTKYGQSLTVKPTENNTLIWQSFDEHKNIWFERVFELYQGTLVDSKYSDEISKRLIQILKATKVLNPKFLSDNKGYKVETHLEFPKQWGLGTSSTLINNIAQWANVDAFKLLENTFGGSGYDIACTKYNTAITYQLNNNKPIVSPINFNPIFKNKIYFVYLNKKQNSRDGIKHYQENKKNETTSINLISQVTKTIYNAKNLEHFQNLISEHESIIAEITGQTPVKKLLFNDFEGEVKSLGAWGGDFVMVVSSNNPTNYFKEKGYATVIPYENMIL